MPIDWQPILEHRAIIGNALFIILIFLARRPIASVLVRSASSLTSAASMPMSGAVRSKLEKPIQVAVVAIAILISSKQLLPPGETSELFQRVISSVFILGVFGIWFQLAETMVIAIQPKRVTGISLETSWLLQIARLIIVTLCFTAILQRWNIEIGTAMTGLGVLGAAAAIASQDLLRNVVAGMSNMGEKRFQQGDWVEIEGIVEGTVAKVDIRSTTVLGLDRIPYYIPNAELANAVVRNKTRRDHRRLMRTVHLSPKTSSAQLEQIVADIRLYLAESGDFCDGSEYLRLANVDDISHGTIEIAIYAFTYTNDYSLFAAVCERLNQSILGIVEKYGAELANPLNEILTFRQEAH